MSSNETKDFKELWKEWANARHIIVPSGRQIGKRTGWVNIDEAPTLPLDNMKLDGTGVWNPWTYGYDTGVADDTPATEPKCEHKWVDVGFQHSKIVCAKCDAEKSEPE